MSADRSSTVFSTDDRRVSKDSTMCTGVKWAHCSLFLLTEQRDKNLETRARSKLTLCKRSSCMLEVFNRKRPTALDVRVRGVHRLNTTLYNHDCRLKTDYFYGYLCGIKQSVVTIDPLSSYKEQEMNRLKVKETLL